MNALGYFTQRLCLDNLAGLLVLQIDVSDDSHFAVLMIWGGRFHWEPLIRYRVKSRRSIAAAGRVAALRLLSTSRTAFVGSAAPLLGPGKRSAKAPQTQWRALRRESQLYAHFEGNLRERKKAETPPVGPPHVPFSVNKSTDQQGR